MNNNNRVSPYSGETNNLKQNGLNAQQNSNDNNSNENSLGRDTNNNNNNQNIRIGDSQVMVEFNCYTPYFTFGNTLFFYCPHSLNNMEISKEYHSTTVKLSEMPDQPFSIGPECKFNFFILIFYLRR